MWLVEASHCRPLILPFHIFQVDVSINISTTTLRPITVPKLFNTTPSKQGHTKEFLNFLSTSWMWSEVCWTKLENDLTKLHELIAILYLILYQLWLSRATWCNTILYYIISLSFYLKANLNKIKTWDISFSVTCPEDFKTWDISFSVTCPASHAGLECQVASGTIYPLELALGAIVVDVVVEPLVDVVTVVDVDPFTRTVWEAVGARAAIPKNCCRQKNNLVTSTELSSHSIAITEMYTRVDTCTDWREQCASSSSITKNYNQLCFD